LKGREVKKEVYNMDKISYNAQRGCKKLSSFFKKNSEEDEEED